MKRWLIFGLVMLLFTTPVKAESYQSQSNVYYDLSELEQIIDSLDEETKGVLSRWGLSIDSVMTGHGIDIQAVGQVVLELLVNSVRSPLQSSTACAGVLLLCALLRGLMPTPLTAMHGITEYFSPLCLGLVLVT
ncbi:MAG: hypothetical protein IKU10_07960, partial [Clostridia bacterium]|nr:hypothetical protein [Clostridia bacterium]